MARSKFGVEEGILRSQMPSFAALREETTDARLSDEP
jgi:hypothetical protein